MLRALLFILVVYLAVNVLFGGPQISFALDGVPVGPLEGVVGIVAAAVAAVVALAVMFALLAGLLVMALGLPILLLAVVICALLAPVLLPLLILFGLVMVFFCGLGTLFA